MVSEASVSYNSEYDYEEEDDDEEEVLAEAIDSASGDAVIVSFNSAESSDDYVEVVAGEEVGIVSENEIISEETVSSPDVEDVEIVTEEPLDSVSDNEVIEKEPQRSESEKQEVSSNKVNEIGKTDESVSKNALIPVSSNEAAYKVTEKAKSYIAESVASMVLLTGSENYDGPVSNDQLKIWHEGASKYIASVNADVGQNFGKTIREPIIYEAVKKDNRITVSGSFVIDTTNVIGEKTSAIYIFSLGGVKDTGEVRYGKIQSDNLKVVNISQQEASNKVSKSISSNESIQSEPSVSVNEPDQASSVSSDMPNVVEDDDFGEVGSETPSIIDYPVEGEILDSLIGNSMNVVESTHAMIIE
jgi:hypothetical protein